MSNIVLFIMDDDRLLVIDDGLISYPHPPLRESEQIWQIVVLQGTGNDISQHVVLHGMFQVITPCLDRTCEHRLTDTVIKHCGMHHDRTIQTVGNHLDAMIPQVLILLTEVQKRVHVCHALSY